jgi:UDPglucose--hexose-1-phosphate uridylyltransferase
MNTISTTLADGRDLVYYFDGEPLFDSAPPDTRELPAPATATQARYDALLDEWVYIAAHRQTRTHLPSADQCPLCPTTAEFAGEVPAAAYDVAVFENRFPSLAEDVPEVEPTVDGEELFPRRKGTGRCEVVCFTSDHNASFKTLTPQRVRTVVEAWADRTAALSAMPDVEQVYVFENRGREIGVTLPHPHGQIYGYPAVTPRTRRQLDSVRAYFAKTGRNLYADLLDAEIKAETRVVARTEHWTAFVPVAARWPLEVHLYPHRRVPDLPALSDAERADFCGIYLEVLRRLDGVYGLEMPYIAAWHQAPVRADRELAHLHLELFTSRRAPGKLKYLAGSESGMGAFINDITPEDAAAMLREVSL